MNRVGSQQRQQQLESRHRDDLKQAASQMRGAERRSFQADMTIKYCHGSARQAETVFGWNRHSVELGLHERRTGIICLGAQKSCCGNKLWEEKHPDVAAMLFELAGSQAQQDPTFRTTFTFTRLTAKAALTQLRHHGVSEEVLPSPRTMADVLNRNGFRLRRVVKANPQKKIPQTDAIFENISEQDGISRHEGVVKRISIDCKATVKIGPYSRGGLTRGETKAADHDMGCTETYTPFGIVDEDSGQLYIDVGSSAKTSDFIMDSLAGWWERLPVDERDALTLLQIKTDNGPESSGRRTQFLKRMVDFVDDIKIPIQLLYYPPYHSKYNPIERCWGILEKHWNGAQLLDVDTMLAWAKSMTWKGISPCVTLSRTVYHKGISLSKTAMREVEARLERNPLLPKWDILIKPA
jgi:hypothetical protein